MNVNIDIFCDGGSRGNPGKAGIGVIIKTQSSKLKAQIIEISKYIGIATNNQAEYTAVIEALKYLDENYRNYDINVNFYLDSQLIVEQLNGNYKIKNEGLKPLYLQVQNLLKNINGEISFTHVRRDYNSEADRLVNEAIDKGIK